MPARIKSQSKKLVQRLENSSLVFLGMMGCGKSAIGKMIATRLGLPFKDSDTEIESAAGRSVKEIFEEFGEPEFRRLETRVIERLLSEGPMVLALGGGAFMSEETRTNINSSAISIWLKADIELLLARVARRPGKRPLLKTGDPREILLKLLAEREPVYSLASLHVSSKSGSKSETRDHVINELETFLETRDITAIKKPAEKSIA